jgi:hypothetical protein
MADTAWNGPLLATSEEWEVYLAERARQRFTAVQWVATHWLAAPTGDLHGERAYHGHERISVNPRFFQQLDRKTQRLTESGMLSVPVMLWAATWSSPQVNALNPGVVLPEDQAILLCRYMLARWSAYPVAWILPGDGVYEGEVAERWKRIGRAVFGEDPHAPVTLHPGGLEWPYDAFRDEPWLDFCGYQSGHSDNERTFAWLVGGAPAQGWEALPTRPVINLEPCYENHIGGPFGFRHDAHAVRRALYWSLLNAPTAGVSYGGHGVWGWDDGTQPSTNHPSTGVPLPWRNALLMPGAEQIAHLVATLESIAWWRLRPAPGLVAAQPRTARTADSRNFIAAAQSAEGDEALVYIPTGGVVELDLRGLTSDLLASWINPRTGAREPVIDQGSATLRRLATPTGDDWLLLFSKG